MAVSGVVAMVIERAAYRPLRHAPRLIPLISAIGVSFFLQDVIRLFESLWRNSFNLVYPTMDVLNHRFELTETIDVSVKSLVVIGAALLMLWSLHTLVTGPRWARRCARWPRTRPPRRSWASTSTASSP
jgi:branched-chain amino acid transport system permease protein